MTSWRATARQRCRSTFRRGAAAAGVIGQQRPCRPQCRFHISSPPARAAAGDAHTPRRFDLPHDSKPIDTGRPFSRLRDADLMMTFPGRPRRGSGARSPPVIMAIAPACGIYEHGAQSRRRRRRCRAELMIAGHFSGIYGEHRRGVGAPRHLRYHTPQFIYFRPIFPPKRLGLLFLMDDKVSCHAVAFPADTLWSAARLLKRFNAFGAMRAAPDVDCHDDAGAAAACV